MFEELYRNHGILQVPLDQYRDGEPQFEEYPVTYFLQECTFRAPSGALQSERVIFCKGFDAPLQPGARFVSSDHTVSDIATSRRIFDHFADGFECYKLTVAK